MPIFTSVGVAAAAAVVAGAAAVVAAAAPVVAAPPAVVADELSESSPHAAATSISATAPPTNIIRRIDTLPRDKKAVLLADLNRAIARRVRSRPHRCTARATSPTSASVRVRSGDCRRSAYARLRAPSPDRRPPVHVEETEVGEQRARGITQGSLDVPGRDRHQERRTPGRCRTTGTG